MVVLLSAASVGLAQPAHRPEGFPGRPVKIIVPFGPGGATDLAARVVAKGMSESWGQAIVVENRAGADGNIGIEHVVRSAPDGYMLVVVPAQNIVVNPHVYPDLRFDIFRDLAPLSLMVKVQHVLVVNPSLNINSLQELIDTAKAKPGVLNYASPSFGSQGHIAAEMFKVLLGVSIQHIPYQGYGPAIKDVLGGQVTMLFAQVPGVLSLVNSGRLKALGVAGAARSRLFPDVPTILEATGVSVDAVSWNALFAPAGTSDAIVSALAREVARALQAPEVRERFNLQGVEPVGSTPAELASFMKAEHARYGEIIRKARIRPDEGTK